MCSAGSPPPPPPPPPPINPGTEVDEAVKTARRKERKKLAAASGRDSTILSPGLLSSTARTSKKTLLGY
jgi:hypothetical protein